MVRNPIEQLSAPLTNIGLPGTLRWGLAYAMSLSRSHKGRQPVSLTVTLPSLSRGTNGQIGTPLVSFTA